jgi:iron complex outermembrane recepter protein
LIAGVNLHNGDIDAKMFGIGPDAAKLAPLSKLDQTARNFAFYAENSFDLVPGFALVAGTNFLHAVREQGVVFSVLGDQAGGQTFDLWSPKLGLLWDIDPGWQVYCWARDRPPTGACREAWTANSAAARRGSGCRRSSDRDRSGSR